MVTAHLLESFFVRKAFSPKAHFSESMLGQLLETEMFKVPQEYIETPFKKAGRASFQEKFINLKVLVRNVYKNINVSVRLSAS